MKKIPYGIINYEKLITNDYLYIDKTMYLENLENTKETLFYLRPGRFGKSLFTSMMYYYYDINSKDKFDTLFKDTYVHKNPTPYKNNYYVLKFDFSGIATENTDNIALERKFKTCVITGINNFLNHYKIAYTIDDQKDSSEIIKYFLSYINGLELTHKIYIVVDEYDNFTNAILEGDAKDFLGAVGNTGFVKSFYACIKEYIGLGVVDRFFATGICPITLNSMTTGFNIASDISTDKDFNSMIGLTHDEVWNLLGEYDEKTRKELFDIMLKHYDGYLFSERLEDNYRIFNATLVMYLLSKFEHDKEIPSNLYDNNIVVNYGKIDNLLKLQNNDFYKPIIDKLLKTNEIESELVTQFNLLEDFAEKEIISLLYYFGYLTIKERNIFTNKMVFKVPNRIMLETYNNYFIKILKDFNITLDTSLEEEYIKEIVLEGKIDKITSYISKIIEMSSNKVYISLNEKYIHLLYTTLLIRNKLITLYDEFQCGDGFADLYIERNNELAKYDILIELKYIKKQDFKESKLNALKEEATKQLKYYETDERIDKGHLKKYIVIFAGSEIKLLESVN